MASRNNEMVFSKYDIKSRNYVMTSHNNENTSRKFQHNKLKFKDVNAGFTLELSHGTIIVFGTI